jgi:NAD(P)-dependent dehydrogenase (short-subunit alcohol dehydrogenase family)
MAPKKPGERAILITGASTGIGAACAQRLDAMGLRVFAGVRRHEDGEALRTTTSARLTPLLLDVTDDAAIAAAVEQVRAATGDAGLWGLVNNAGIAVAGPMEFLPIPELRRQMEINVVAQVAVTQALLPLIRAARGRIVNMGSISGRLATPFVGAYSASKFALEALTDVLRIELRPWGIAVVIVEPGGIATPIWERSLATADRLLAEMPPELEQYYGPVIPVIRKSAQRTGARGTPPAAVADVVAHALTAARPRTRYVVGERANLVTRLVARMPDRLRDRLVARQLPKYP